MSCGTLPAVHLRPEHRILEDQVVRDDAGLEDFSRVRRRRARKRLSALTRCSSPAAESSHSAAARMRGMMSNGISRSWASAFAVDREGDADAAEQELGLAPAIVEHVVRNFGEPARQLAIGRAHRARRCRSSRRTRPPWLPPVARPRHHAKPRVRRILPARRRANPSGDFGRAAGARISALCPCFGRQMNTRRARANLRRQQLLDAVDHRPRC